MDLADNPDPGHDHRVQEPTYKKIEDALLDLATKGTSSNDMVQAVDLTYLVNKHFGVRCWPWEVEDIPAEWIHLIIKLHSDLPKMAAGIDKIKRIKESIVSNHETYRPIPKRH